MIGKGGTIPLKVKFCVRDSGEAVGYCRLGRCDKPNTFDQVVEKAVKRKVPKLVRTVADKKILLLQRDKTERLCSLLDLPRVIARM